MIEVFTDGSCNNKTKNNGGCGIVILHNGEENMYYFGQYTNTTSARMEIRAILHALQLIIDKTIPVTIYSDNQYCVNSIKLGWAENWELQNWNGRVNADLWKQVLFEYRKFKTCNFVWLKGHNGHLYNEMADILADNGAKSSDIISD